MLPPPSYTLHTTTFPLPGPRGEGAQSLPLHLQVQAGNMTAMVQLFSQVCQLDCETVAGYIGPQLDHPVPAHSGEYACPQPMQYAGHNIGVSYKGGPSEPCHDAILYHNVVPAGQDDGARGRADHPRDGDGSDTDTATDRFLHSCLILCPPVSVAFILHSIQ